MSALNWLNIVTIVAVAVGLVAVIVVATMSIRTGRMSAAERTAYFQRAYGSSVDRMLVESHVDKDALRALRDTSDHGVVAAARELIHAEPIPLKPAAEFIKRL